MRPCPDPTPSLPPASPSRPARSSPSPRARPPPCPHFHLRRRLLETLPRRYDPCQQAVQSRPSAVFADCRYYHCCCCTLPSLGRPQKSPREKTPVLWKFALEGRYSSGCLRWCCWCWCCCFRCWCFRCWWCCADVRDRSRLCAGEHVLFFPPGGCGGKEKSLLVLYP